MSGPVSLLDKWRLLQAVLRDSDLSPAAKVVAGRLLFHLNTRTSQCSPSFETLAQGAGITRSSAMRAMRELRGAGWVEREHSTRDGTARHLSNEYRLAFDRAIPAEEVVSEWTPPDGVETDTRVVSKRTPRVVSKRTPKQGKREQGKGTRDLLLDAAAFGRFWQAYPRKVGKAAAERVFLRILRDGKAMAEELIAGAERYRAERSREDPTYTKHPQTWLNAGSWLDEPAPRAAPPRSNGQQPFSAIDALMRNLDHDE